MNFRKKMYYSCFSVHFWVKNRWSALSDNCRCLPDPLSTTRAATSSSIILRVFRSVCLKTEKREKKCSLRTRLGEWVSGARIPASSPPHSPYKEVAPPNGTVGRHPNAQSPLRLLSATHLSVDGYRNPQPLRDLNRPVASFKLSWTTRTSCARMLHRESQQLAFFGKMPDSEILS